MATEVLQGTRDAYARKVDRAVAEGKLSDEAAKNLKRWLLEPQYSDYFGRLTELIDGEEWEELQQAFWTVIPFGTGGRRGRMGELGTATINSRTIAESAHGVALYLKREKPSGGRAVVAHDSRNRSREFAELTASVLAADGLQVYLFPSERATPELSFAVRYLNCDIGVVISASHNPPSDNGFKAYWRTGCQVLPPHDRKIIECVESVKEIPTIDFNQAVQEGKIVILGEDVDNAYVEAVARLSVSDARDIKALYTPLHGVGETSIYRVLQKAGFQQVEIFEPQREPNGDFPNVPDHLPNPENTKAFAPAIEYAQRHQHDIVLASDPDADRIAVAVRKPDGSFACLTGNQVGALLTDYLLSKRRQMGKLSPEDYVVETLVTTPLIAAIAESYGVQVVRDLLVGFKYIGQTVDQRGAEHFVFGAEESLGYLAGDYARDKDGAVGALYALELAAELRREGKTLLDQLDQLYLRHGYYSESQRSIVCEGDEGKAQIQRLMSLLRDQPPKELAGWTLERVFDYGRHEVRSLPDNAKIQDLPRPEGDLLFFESSQGERTMRFAARPSGTEPKIKFYFFAYTGCPDAASLPAVKQSTDEQLARFSEALQKWVNDNLAK